jgi:tetratricopeptide (TPR) repeat protein
MKIAFIPLILAVTLCALTFSAQEQQEPHHHHESAEALGTISFPTSCSPAVQDTFTRGVALLYSFEYESAAHEFDTVSQRDPKCAMAYWGQGMSLYHQLWDPPSKADLKRGAEFLAKARQLNAPTPRERDYIQALSVFYADTDKLDHSHRADAYSQAMKAVYERYPDDREAAVFYALSLLGSGTENDPNHTNEKAAVAILNKLFDEQPTHPGIAHYIIHACDNPQMASLALPAARKYASIAPASAHAVHMPSHIFARLGLWQDDIQSNLAAIKVADSMAGMHFHVMHHKMHSMDFLEYAYLQIGDDANAKSEVAAFAAINRSEVEPEYLDFLEVRQARATAIYAIERRQWKEALALQPIPNAVPYAQSVAYWGRAVAAGHLHDSAAAKDALKHYDKLMEATRKGPKPYVANFLKNEHGVVQAWAYYASGKSDEALRLLHEVADTQDKVGKGETELPAREMLADMLLDLQRPKEAFEQYEIALRTDPNRFNGLYGAAQAAAQTQQKEKASAYYAQLLKNCESSNSDRPELTQAKTIVAAK